MPSRLGLGRGLGLELGLGLGSGLVYVGYEPTKALAESLNPVKVSLGFAEPYAQVVCMLGMGRVVRTVP